MFSYVKTVCYVKKKAEGRGIRTLEDLRHGISPSSAECLGTHYVFEPRPFDRSGIPSV